MRPEGSMPQAHRSLSIVLMLSCTVGGCASVGRSERGISNFADVQAGVIYRGGQPAPEGIETLKQYGVRTVINLRNDPPGWEEKEMIAAGFDYIWIPMIASDVKPAEVEEFLRAMKSAPRPIFVHCRLGRDRTGAAVGAFRITQEGWTHKQAIRELYDHGYNWALYPGIKRYLKTLDMRDSARPSTSQIPPSR